MDEMTFRRKVAVDAGVGGIGSIDAGKMVRALDIADGSFRANRRRLETLIRKDMDVKWGYGVEKFEVKPQGTILYAQEGQVIEAPECIVGADGPHSNIRKTLLPDVELEVLPYVTFKGDRRVPRSTFEEIYAPAMQGTNIIETRKNDALLQISINDISDDTVRMSWMSSRAAQGPDHKCFKPNRSVSEASTIPEQFYQEISSLKDLEQPYKETFSEQKVREDRVLSWLMRSANIDYSTLQDVPGSVFFLGDSLHAEPILGGEGANAAITDALELAEHIVANSGRESGAWYKNRMPLWQQSLQKRKQAIEAIHKA